MKLVTPRLCRISRLGKPLHCCVMALVVVGCCVSAPGDDQSSPPPRWKTGADFERALSARTDDVVWSAGTPLRQALATIARTQRVALMLDRRIDPGSAIELSVRDASVRQILEQLAAQCAAVPTYLDGVVYVGPRGSTLHLSTVAQERRGDTERLPRPLAQRLAAKHAWRWDDLAEPRALVAELAQEADIRVEGGEQLPHDLWPALDLPALPWTDRMTLVLTGFGLTFALDDGGRTVRLVPQPAPALVSRTYPVILSSSQLDAVKTLFPQATIDERAHRVELSGTPEEHERLTQLLQRQVASRAPKRQAGTVLTLKVTQQPVKEILRTLAQRLGVEFQTAADLEERLGTRVSLDVREVPLPELLDAALAPAGLTHRRVGAVIIIEPRDP